MISVTCSVLNVCQNGIKTIVKKVVQWQFAFIAASQTDKDGDDPARHGSVYDVDVGALFHQKTAF